MLWESPSNSDPGHGRTAAVWASSGRTAPEEVIEMLHESLHVVVSYASGLAQRRHLAERIAAWRPRRAAHSIGCFVRCDPRMIVGGGIALSLKPRTRLAHARPSQSPGAALLPAGLPWAAEPGAAVWVDHPAAPPQQQPAARSAPIWWWSWLAPVVQAPATKVRAD
jgi:hypothetical protein